MKKNDKKPINDNNLKMFWLTLAHNNDTILQSYRIIFISSETILISFATLLFTFPNSILKMVLIISLFIIGVALVEPWKKITWNRGLQVFYCYMQVELLEEGKLSKKARKKPFLSFCEWQNKIDLTEKEKQIEDYRKKHDQESIYREYPRLILGVILPRLYLSLWVVILFVHVISFLF